MVKPLEDTNAQDDLNPRVDSIVALENGEEGINGVLRRVKISRQVNTSTLHQKAHRGEHGHTAVLDFSLAKPLRIEGLGKSQRIELGISLLVLCIVCCEVRGKGENWLEMRDVFMMRHLYRPFGDPFRSIRSDMRLQARCLYQ